MKVIILAAGAGKRLGKLKLPKPLTNLVNGFSILGWQLKHLEQIISLHDITVVVGYKKEKIMEDFPDLLYVYNPLFSSENTAKSLLRAIEKIDDDLLFLNGDVVCHPNVLKKMAKCKKSSMLVNIGNVGDEEVKYIVNDKNKILAVSKEVKEGQGEALGINFIKKTDLVLFKKHLKKVKVNDYFEKAIEKSIKEGLNIFAVPVDKTLCMEIDFKEDLNAANQMIKNWKISK